MSKDTQDLRKCHSCAYKRNIAGNCHISCALDWNKSEHNPPEANEHGIRSGWYYFPANFDPVWQTTPCKEYSTTEDPKKVGTGDMFDLTVQMIENLFRK